MRKKRIINNNQLFIILSIYRKLSFRRKRKLVFLLLTMFLSAISEIFTLSAVYPFLSLLTEKEKFINRISIRTIIQRFEFINSENIFLIVTFVFIFAAFVSGYLRIYNLLLSTKFAAYIGNDFSCETYRKTLFKSYNDHLLTNSSEIIARASSLVVSIQLIVLYTLQILTSISVFFAILIGLLLLEPKVAIFVLLIFGGVYILLALLTRKRLKINSKLIADAQSRQINSLQEGLGAIREVLLGGLQDFYLSVYKKSDVPIRFKGGENVFLASYPRYLLETLGLIIISLVAIFLSNNKALNVVQILGTFAIGAQRLLPTMQLIYFGWSGINGQLESAKKVLEMIDIKSEFSDYEFKRNQWKFNELIKLSNVYYKYPNSPSYVIKNISVEISKGEKIGIMGETGSGKSTLVDLIIGLIKPSKGAIEIDNINILKKDYPSNLLNWRYQISHVPQSIFLSDSSIRENIAFGVPINEIDDNLVREVAKIAEISSYIESCKNRYETFVGERGIRLSGGQRQRLGLARALYKKSKILILDEATSALDNKTEAKIMKNIESLDKDITIIMIAHRLRSLRKCDRIFKINNGKINNVLEGNEIINLE